MDPRAAYTPGSCGRPLPPRKPPPTAAGGLRTGSTLPNGLQRRRTPADTGGPATACQLKLQASVLATGVDPPGGLSLQPVVPAEQCVQDTDSSHDQGHGQPHPQRLGVAEEGQVLTEPAGDGCGDRDDRTPRG